MALYTQLAAGTVTTADVAVITVPAGEAWAIYSITFFHPATGVLNTIQVGLGTTATPANVKYFSTLAAGIAKDTLYPGIGLPAAATLNMVASAETGIATFTVNGFKQKTV